MKHSPPDGLNPELRAFLYSCIDSVEQLEVLLCLQLSDRTWTAKAVCTELALSASAARTHLETLAARGLLHITVGEHVAYRYAPRSVDLRRYGDQLAEHYSHSAAQILRYVAANPRGSIRRFADAFKLRDPE